MTKKFYCYLVTCKVNGKIYIGHSGGGSIKCVTYRWNGHCFRALYRRRPNRRSRLHSAIRKYGKDNFTVKVLNGYSKTLKSANAREIKLIREHKQRGFKLYNLTAGGGGTLGAKQTPESNRLRSIALKGKKFSKERNEKIRNAWKDPIIRKKIIKARTKAYWEMKKQRLQSIIKEG